MLDMLEVSGNAEMTKTMFLSLTIYFKENKDASLQYN